MTFAEPEEPDHDDQPVGGAVLEGLQAAVGPRGVRGGQHASCPLGSHLEAGHCPLQQVILLDFSNQITDAITTV